MARETLSDGAAWSDDMETLFREWDQDHDGLVEPDEVGSALRETSELSEADEQVDVYEAVRRVFHEIDIAELSQAEIDVFGDTPTKRDAGEERKASDASKEQEMDGATQSPSAIKRGLSRGELKVYWSEVSQRLPPVEF